MALATDHTSERDFARICDPDQVGRLCEPHRLRKSDHQRGNASEDRAAPDGEAAAQILPDEEVDVVAYGCTAASIVLGNDTVTRLSERRQAGHALRHAKLCCL